MTTTPTPELKPCPFCGGEQTTTGPDRKFGDITWHVICKSCGVDVWRDLETEAIEAWNTRAAPTPEPVARPPEVEALVEALRYALDTHDVSYDWEAKARAALAQMGEG